jgi:eukaryotic-like serine/threonine-protein kinase
VNDPIASSTLSRLLDEALDLPLAQRQHWLAALDASYDEFKPRLRALLMRTADVESLNFLGTLPTLADSDVAEGDGPTMQAEGAGARVGPYRLERQLGSGGMGTVWLATRADGLFDRSIALKLPHRGMYGADLAARMARERSILAGFEHPHIARLYDAGLTDDGQPYLALEYIEGVAIDAYCRSHACDLRERLRLFLQVADAVASAHARLVVHRDLKPANILVTNDGNVCLLDFGIAKLLDAPTPGQVSRLTQLSVHALTPDYASPEQITGEAVTITSDVYSLGVVLYELLTGERPYRLRRDTRGALEDAILQVEPRRPSDTGSEFARALRGDLDTITMKALHKKAINRYATVNALADDVRRCVERRPVLARPDSHWYRSSRFLRRHRLAAAAVAAVSVAVIVGAVVSTIGFVKARSAERSALAEAETARQVSAFMVDLFKVSDPGEARGNTITAREILDKASARVTGELSAAPEIRATLMATMADVYAKLGLYAEASRLALPALELRQMRLPNSLQLADSLNQVGEIYSLLSRGADAEPLHRRALALRQTMAPDDHAALAKTLRHLAVAHHVRQDLSNSLNKLLEARQELQLVAQPDPAQLGDLVSHTANIYRELGDFRSSVPLFREALRIFRTALGENHPMVASSLGDLAMVLKDTEQYAEAEAAYLASIASLSTLLGPKHPDVADMLSNIAVFYLERNRNTEALLRAQAASDIFGATLGDEHEKTSNARLNVVQAHIKLEHFQQAEQECRVILAIRRRLLTTDSRSLGATISALASALNYQLRFRESEPYAREAGTIVEKAVGRGHWRFAAANRTLGVSLAGQRRYAEAEVVLLESYQLLRKTRGNSNRTTQSSLQRLIELYRAWGKTQQANELQTQLTAVHGP